MHGRAPPCGSPPRRPPSSPPSSPPPLDNLRPPAPSHRRAQRRDRRAHLLSAVPLLLALVAVAAISPSATASASASATGAPPHHRGAPVSDPAVALQTPAERFFDISRYYKTARGAVFGASAAPAPPIDLAFDLPAERPVRGGHWMRRRSHDPANLLRIKGSGIARKVFDTAVAGAKLTISFDNLRPGAYDVTLGFIEPSFLSCHLGARVFSVEVGGHLRIPALDLFATSGCNAAMTRTFERQTVDPLEPRPLTIVLTGLVGEAVLSYVRIKTSGQQCVPEATRGRVEANHVAHAVPGTYPPIPDGASQNNNRPTSYVDRLGAGFVWVSIDGSGSHTHFVGTEGGDVLGRITRFRWFNVETGALISTRARFQHKFQLGTTRLRLEVTDNVCSSDEAQTSVTVTGKVQDGAYCYYYAGLSALPGPGTLHDHKVRPTFAAVQQTLDFKFPEFDFVDSQFVVRCMFFLSTGASTRTTFHVETGGTGAARLYRKGMLLVDTTASPKKGAATLAGLAPYELIYQRGNIGATPSLKLRLNSWVPRPGSVSHDQSHVLPIVTSIHPPSGPVTGGGRTRITGYGLFQPMTVRFGRWRTAVVLAEESNQNVLYVRPPSGRGKGDVYVGVQSSNGLRSNELKYAYGSGCDPIDFQQLELRTSAGATLNLPRPTTITMWQDGSLYIGTYGGMVQVVSYDASALRTTGICYSEKFTDMRFRNTGNKPPRRAVLGLTFDPRDTVGMPYVSTSTLFHLRYGSIDYRKYSGGWRNGAVEQLMPATAATRAADPRRCLQWRRRVVENLPVANSDHAVNALQFTQDGDLLIAIGGHTNAGLPNPRTGGTWESYFSSAVVIARMSRPDYNGVIRYTTDNPRTARPISGDVELFSTGLRNTFAMTMLRNGAVMAADNGANCEFGNASTWCGLYNEAEAANRWWKSAEGVPSDAVFSGRARCADGDRQNPQSKDKIVQLEEGRFYGHANLMRTPDECMWINPYTGRGVAYPGNRPAPKRYRPPSLLVRSPVTGLVEYGAKHFCGRLRGEIITAAYNGLSSFRIRLPQHGPAPRQPHVQRQAARFLQRPKTPVLDLDEDLDVAELSRMAGQKPRVERLWRTSGLTVTEDPYGQLIFPKINSREVVVLRPRVSAWRRRAGGAFVANALPARHGVHGGSRLRIGGWGFAAAPHEGKAARALAVSVGGHACRIVNVVQDHTIVCIVPPGPPNGLVDVVVQIDGRVQRLAHAVKYMRV